MKEIDDDILKIEADLKKFSAECINWIKKLDIYFLAILIFLMILGIIFSITYNSYYIFIISLLSIPVFSYFYFFKKLNNPKVISADRYKKNIENYIQSSTTHKYVIYINVYNIVPINDKDPLKYSIHKIINAPI